MSTGCNESMNFTPEPIMHCMLSNKNLNKTLKKNTKNLFHLGVVRIEEIFDIIHISTMLGKH